MFGVRYPITPFVYALTLDIPMSSPQMTRILGFGDASACATPTARTTAAVTAKKEYTLFLDSI
jgi:hypothetical protein